MIDATALAVARGTVGGGSESAVSKACGVRKLDPCDVQDVRVAQFVGETELTLRHRVSHMVRWMNRIALVPDGRPRLRTHV